MSEFDAKWNSGKASWWHLIVLLLLHVKGAIEPSCENNYCHFVVKNNSCSTSKDRSGGEICTLVNFITFVRIINYFRHLRLGIFCRITYNNYPYIPYLLLLQRTERQCKKLQTGQHAILWKEESLTRNLSRTSLVKASGL